MLKIQYRMNPEISAFPSYVFYDNDLIDSDYVKERKLD